MTRTALRFLIATLSCAGLGHAGLAWSQSIPTPGAVQEQLRKPQMIPPTKPEAIPLTPAPSAAAGVAPGGKPVQIQRFEITGNTVIDTETLHQVVAPYEGKLLTLAEIYDVADLLTRYYRTHGYALSSANVPPQKVSSGVITLEIIEGTLGAVNTEGNRWYKERALKWQLNELKPGDVVRSAPLEHEMLSLNDMPGLEAKAVLQPGSEFGTSDLTIKTTEKLLEGAVRINNYGRTSIGEWRIEADGAVNSLLGYGDRLDVSAVYAEADLLHYGRLAYSVPVSPWGTRASVYYSKYAYQVNAKKLGADFAQLDIDGDGDNFGVNFLHPVWRSQTRNLFVGLGYDRTITHQIESSFIPVTRTSGDITLAVATALFNYLAPDQSFSTVGATFSTNFDGNKRDPLTLSPENNAQTAKLQIDLSHLRPVYRQLSVLARFSGAASVDPLVDTEQFRLGGPTSVRAYPSSELSGDGGFFASGELQHPVDLIPGLYNQKLKLFVDTGRVYRKNHNLIGVRESESLTGVGFGYEAFAVGRVAIDVTLAHPLGAHDASDHDYGLRFWTGINANF